MEENSIEEDIKIMENIIKSYIKADKCGLSNNDFKHEIQALSNILSDYKNIKRKLGYISEICVENSKQHIDDRQSIAKIIKILQNKKI